MTFINIKKYLYLLAVMVTAMQLSAQSIKGRVVEKNATGIIPVPFAHVLYTDTAIGTVTDSLGRFELQRLENHRFITASFVGLTSDTVEITETNYQGLTITTEQVMELDEVQVEAESKATKIDRLNPIKSTIMTEKELFKAACCNLSESFETNPSVDVTYSDAITGAKQIQMLGLAGIYTQITTENLPGVRGLSAPYGLGYIPGTWVESIQVTKGIGSVANGFESITGQVNAELRKPESKDRIFANGYANTQGRYEGNLVLTQPVNKYISTALLMHGSSQSGTVDQNKDGFMDMPNGTQLNVINRWQFHTTKRIEGMLGVKALIDNREAGQVNNGSNAHHLYMVNMKTERFELFGKTGYVFPTTNYSSVGLMWSALTHSQNSSFGKNLYNTRQQSLYANLIYQSMFGNTNHKYRTGLSFMHDRYNESIAITSVSMDTAQLNRVEQVPGAFFEYTWTIREKWMIISGLRADYHNLFGFFATPRLHARYDHGNGTVLHLTAGRGQRTSNIFAENVQLFTTSRNFYLPQNWETRAAYGLRPEVAWNFGLSMTTEIKLGRRKSATLEADVFRTEFENQVVVDLDNSARSVSIYNLNGRSYANSAQVQITYEPVRRLEVRAAYRYYDVKTQYQSGLLQKYLVSNHRAFINVAYKTRDKKWVMDVTASWFGPKRLPTTSDNPEDLRLPSRSPSYTVLHAQVTRVIGKRWEVYAGGENLLDQRQQRLILSPDQPFGNHFDASVIWGPVQGRMVYAGFRFRLKQ